MGVLSRQSAAFFAMPTRLILQSEAATTDYPTKRPRIRTPGNMASAAAFGGRIGCSSWLTNGPLRVLARSSPHSYRASHHWKNLPTMSATSLPLTGKVAIVTGSSRNIGASIAKKLGADGASVVVNYVSNASAAQEVVSAIPRERPSL